jgi:hypothetical protein
MTRFARLVQVEGSNYQVLGGLSTDDYLKSWSRGVDDFSVRRASGLASGLPL